MPDPILGFNRDEIISKVLDTAGRTGDAVLQARLQEDLNLHQLRYWKIQNWKWGSVNGIDDDIGFDMVDGQDVYTLDTATINAEMRVVDVDKIYIENKSFARVFSKSTLQELRVYNPSNDDVGTPFLYAESDKNKVKIWPVPSSDEDGIRVFLDGRRMPNFITQGDQYPDVPIESQESFIQYILYKTYVRLEDPRQEEALSEFQLMISEDKDFDLQNAEDNSKFGWPEEHVTLGGGILPAQNVMWWQVGS